MLNKRNALFYGAASEVITPFANDGSVAYDLLEQEIQFMIDHGVTGFFVNGLASEALVLTKEERKKCAKVVYEACKGRVPVMGNIIANSVEDGVESAHTYAKIGYDAIIITPPPIYKYTQDGIFEFFDSIASSTELPCYIYNAPETGNKLSPAMIAKLFEKNERFMGYKDSTQSIIEQQTLIGLIGEERHFELLAGSDAQIVTTAMLGGAGGISLITVVFPDLIVECCEACEKGEWEKAIELQQKILKVREALKCVPFMAAYKYVSGRLGRPLGGMRKPMAYVSEKDCEIIEGKLKALGLL